MGNPIRDLFNEAALEASADVLLLNSDIMPGADESVRKVLEERSGKRDAVIVILVTSGGLPDIAYRIAMALHARYDRVTICMSSP